MGAMLRLRPTVPALLFASAFCLALGVTLPIVRFEKLLFLSDTPSLVDLLLGLWSDGSVWLAGIVFLFSFVFPVCKLLITFQAAFGQTEPGAGLPSWTTVLAKWSMMDVVLVALVVMAAKTSGFATAMAQPGLWFYAASAIGGAAAAGLMRARRSDAALGPMIGEPGSGQIGDRG